MGKRPNVITPERLEEVENLLGLGRTPREIQRMCAAKWLCTRRTVRNAIRKVRQILAASATPDDRHEARLQLDTVFRLAMARGDLRTAGRVAVEKCRMAGLYPEYRVEVTGKGGGPLQIEDAREALRKHIERIAASKRPPNGEAGT